MSGSAARLLFIAPGIAALSCSQEAPPAGPVSAAAAGPELPSAATFVGRESCAPCHAEEDELWRGSHHDLAMQPATEETVLGDFDGASFEHFGVTSSLSRQDGKFLVRTDGADGELHEYEVAYAFGVYPLQQYLVEFPRGYYQTLPLCWDSRPTDEGGQRWFHIYPDEAIPPDDLLHWTGPYQNWNFMCAECHSTDLQKTYVLEEDRYETSWFELDVSCEACHGPGSRHVAWAEARERGETLELADTGLAVVLKDRNEGRWIFDRGEGMARRTRPRSSRAQIETCARCHSRRSVIHEPYEHGRPLLDTHRPMILDEGLYHADGQILEEVYVYASFAQSRMYAAGVTCSDCHDSHSLAIDGTGDGVCSACHKPERFAVPEHHHHEPGTEGASCVECHMPATTYMVVDPRRDHSMRVPRPDLALELGVPDACSGCHVEESVEWSVEAFERWYGEEATAKPHFGQILKRGREGDPAAGASLAALARDEEHTPMVRATALSLLPLPLTAASLQALQRGLADDDPLVRVTALTVLEGADPRALAELVADSLRDPVSAVRQEAARILAPAVGELGPLARAAFERAAEEFLAGQLLNADRASANLNLGVFYLQRGAAEEAEAAYRRALRLEPRYAATYVNLADLYRAHGRDEEGERVLSEGLAVVPEQADLLHSLGLLRIRQGRTWEALDSLRRAAELRTDRARYALVHALALEATGEPAGAMDVLERAHERHPFDLEILSTLVRLAPAAGEAAGGEVYRQKLERLVRSAGG